MSQKVYSQSWTYSPTARDWYFCPGRRLIGSPSSDDAALVHSDAVDADAAEMTKLVSHTAGRWWPGGRRASVEDGAAYDKDGLHAFTPAIHASSCRKWPASGVKCELWGGPLPECSRPATGDPPCLAGWHARRRAADSVGMRHRGWLNDKELSRGVDRLPAITDTIAICHFHPPPPVFLLPQPHAAIYI